MLKFIMAAFIATVCWMTTAQAQVKTEGVVSVMVECTSDGQYVECPTGYDFTEVKLRREDRSGACVYGSTWGKYGQSIWVNHGCSGRFEVTIDDDGTLPPPPPRPLPIHSVDCRFNSVNWQPFYRVNNQFIGRSGFGFQDANNCTQSVQMSRRNAVCNWVGNGFTPYDIESNRELIFAAYPDLVSCYDAL